MKDSRLGMKIVGNFRPEKTVEKSEVEYIFKKNNQLYIHTMNDDIELFPLGGDYDKAVIQNFSEKPMEENETIYDFELLNGNIVVVLYVFPGGTLRIELESETMHFYPDRLNVTQYLLDEYGIKDDIAFLYEEFMKNKSVFIIDDYHGKTTKTFQMYGEEFVATCSHNRQGVYQILRIKKYKVNNRSDELKQIYGHIKFVSFNEQIHISGNDFPAQTANTNAIFKAWDEYEQFEKEIFEAKVVEYGFAKYHSYRILGENIEFNLIRDYSKDKLFLDNEQEQYGIPVVEGTDFSDVKNIINKAESYVYLKSPVALTDNTISFKAPFYNGPIPESGFLVLANQSLDNEIKRRKKVMRVIESKKNTTANTLMKLAEGKKNTEQGGFIKPITSESLEKMFGDKNFPIKENYREAINIALNTPDIALIQGPPGTGKTTLIKGIISRLEAQGDKNYKVLVSSEQHEALYNVVNKLSNNKLIPPFVSSERYYEDDEKAEEDAEKMAQNVLSFQKELILSCDRILEEKDKNTYSYNMTSVVFLINQIKSQQYNPIVIKENIGKISALLCDLGISEKAESILDNIESKLSENSQNHIPSTNEKRLIVKIKSQRKDPVAFFNDDGLYQLNELQNLLAKNGYNNYLIDGELLNCLKIENETAHPSFDKFISYVQKIETAVIGKSCENELNSNDIGFEGYFEKLLQVIKENEKSKKRDLKSIIEELRFRLMDFDTASQVVKKYTDVVGSTCAQAHKSLEAMEMESGQRFDYVIIDEAARANPLDIMIPILLGTKVILIGDQNQLPHYLEIQIAKEFQKNKEKFQQFNIELLQKSLFQVIFDAVEKTYNEGNMSFKRHITLSEQHRMAPDIGNFISEVFYPSSEGVGTLANGSKTALHTNEYGIFDNKNIVWSNVPNLVGGEEGALSYYRDVEVDKVVSIIKSLQKARPLWRFDSEKQLGSKNSDGTINDNVLNIGIMSFYKEQIAKINAALKDPDKGALSSDDFYQIKCGTVDTLQGKEFDIVILSTTRSNARTNAAESLGFIHYSKSRINVALSRARRLLIIVGDMNTMGRNDSFSKLIDYTKKVGIVEGEI